MFACCQTPHRSSRHENQTASTGFFVDAQFCIFTAEDDDRDTLRHLLVKSDFVVIGEVTSDIFKVIEGAHAPQYIYDFKVSEVLSDKVKRESMEKVNLRVDMVHYEDNEGADLPCMKKGAKCILFLKWKYNEWQQADAWFSMFPYGRGMAATLRIVAAENPKTENHRPHLR